MTTGLVFKVRPVKMQDVPVLEMIDRQNFDNAWNDIKIHRYLAVPWHSIAVAMMGPDVVGAVYISRKGGTCKIRRIVVDKEFHRGHVGTGLVWWVKNRAASKRIVVNVPEDNLIAQLFFRSQGFKAFAIDGDKYLFEYVAGK